ncbi:TAP42-like family protein [Apiospora kogelbergensis]|uniref:TAP42-like family protein n=1 Tax=Apiospora kogelbergensis TaxID=1337665 RepID=A0AAW0QS62_9PEZI
MEEPKTLKSVFLAAESKKSSLDGAFEASHPTYREDLEFALKAYQECLRYISQISLFSNNESIEDINTSDLPYLLVSFRIAELLQKISVSTPLERRAALRTTREAYEQFLHLLDNYGLLSPSDLRLFSMYQEDPERFSTISTTDPAARRNAKIANFKHEKEMKQKLEYMRHSPRHLENGGDEEAVRELHLANTSYCAYMTFQALEGISREMDVLAQAPVPLIPTTTTVEEDERRRQSPTEADDYSGRLDAPFQGMRSSGPLLSQDGKPLRPFTLTNGRQDLQQGVFRSGHNLPTMSIDQYLEEERKRGGIIEGGGEASGRQATPDEDNYEKADAETMKAREWDEYVEANPKGSGNTLNRG